MHGDVNLTIPKIGKYSFKLSRVRKLTQVQLKLLSFVEKNMPVVRKGIMQFEGDVVQYRAGIMRGKSCKCPMLMTL